MSLNKRIMSQGYCLFILKMTNFGKHRVSFDVISVTHVDWLKAQIVKTKMAYFRSFWPLCCYIDYSCFQLFCHAQPQLRLQLWLRLALISNSLHHPHPRAPDRKSREYNLLGQPHLQFQLKLT